MSEERLENEAKLKDQANKTHYKYIHFASHGIIAPGSPLSSALLLSKDNPLSPKQMLATTKSNKLP